MDKQDAAKLSANFRAIGDYFARLDHRLEWLDPAGEYASYLVVRERITRLLETPLILTPAEAARSELDTILRRLVAEAETAEAYAANLLMNHDGSDLAVLTSNLRQIDPGEILLAFPDAPGAQYGDDEDYRRRRALIDALRAIEHDLRDIMPVGLGHNHPPDGDLESDAFTTVRELTSELERAAPSIPLLKRLLAHLFDIAQTLRDANRFSDELISLSMKCYGAVELGKFLLRWIT